MTSACEDQRSYRQVLADRRLAILLVGDAVSKVGDGMSFVALPLLALRLHGSVDPALAISLVTAAPFVLPTALSLFFGLGRRRFDPRLVLLADASLRAVAFVALGLLGLAGALSLWSLAAVLFLSSVLRLLSASSRRLVASAMVDHAGRLAVNGLIGTSDSLALYVAGPALGGFVAALTGPELVLLIDGSTYAALLAAVLAVVPRTPERAPAGEPGVKPSSGWAIMLRVPIALQLFVVVFFFDLFYGPVEVALPLLVTEALRAGSGALGGLWTSFGIGALVGALLTNVLRGFNQTSLLLMIIAGWGGSVVLLALAHSLTVAGIAFALGGLVYGPFTAVAYTLLQNSATDDEQQPIFALWAAGITLAAPIGLAMGGPLVAATGARGGLLVSGVVTALLVLPSARWLRAARGRPPDNRSAS